MARKLGIPAIGSDTIIAKIEGPGEPRKGVVIRGPCIDVESETSLRREGGLDLDRNGTSSLIMPKMGRGPIWIHVMKFGGIRKRQRHVNSRPQQSSCISISKL